MQKKVFIYLKVSKPSLLHVQKQVLTKYCKQNDWQVVKAFSDLGELMEAVKRKEADIVLVDTITRLSRDKMDELATSDITLVSIAETKSIEGMI